MKPASRTGTQHQARRRGNHVGKRSFVQHTVGSLKTNTAGLQRCPSPDSARLQSRGEGNLLILKVHTRVLRITAIMLNRHCSVGTSARNGRQLHLSASLGATPGAWCLGRRLCLESAPQSVLHRIFRIRTAKILSCYADFLQQGGNFLGLVFRKFSDSRYDFF